MQITISLRDWAVGETFSSTGAWIIWNGPDYYSLSVQSQPGSCKSWQTLKMYWYGGSNVGPKPGYWRSSNTTDNFIACLYSPAWLGYVSPSNNNLGEWFTGYQGILCADWQVGFSKMNIHEWGLWPNPIWNIIRLILILIAIIICLVIVVRSTLAGALQKKNVMSVYFKLLMNHIQLLAMTSTFNLKWSNSVNSIFNSSQQVAEVSTQIFSLDWFLDQRKYGRSNTTSLYYIKMIMIGLLPIVITIWCYIVWTIYYWFIKAKVSKDKKISRIVSSIIILFLFIHPSLVQYMFSIFE